MEDYKFHLAKEDSILSKKSKKHQKDIANKPYWENTHPIKNAIEAEENVVKDYEPKDGYKLLNQIYGGKSKAIDVKKIVKNYSNVVNHLEEHIKEKVGDPHDVQQSKYLRKEIKQINKQTLIPANKIMKSDELYKYSNPKTVQKKAFHLLGKNAIIYKSDKKGKKYMILDDETGKFIYFGAIPYEDYTKHGDEKRRQSYLKRSMNIKGDWYKNIYSPNFLAIVLLW